MFCVNFYAPSFLDRLSASINVFLSTGVSNDHRCYPS